MNLPSCLDEICLKAIRKYGIPSQEAVALGELGELIALFGKRAQGRDTPEQWVDEITDGLIMLHQLAHIHGAELVEARMRFKLDKLSERIAKP